MTHSDEELRMQEYNKDLIAIGVNRLDRGKFESTFLLYI